ncbi:MAG TPA: hypothetical protein VGS01_13075 [Candidatus Limnocylindria bacterium]|jgi:hypothetical protein|nr:hypothetical protein [Candidatus Limnocylindria bacterium]
MSDDTMRASDDGAALLERASAPSRPVRMTRRQQRAGVASREREERRGVELARSDVVGRIGR